MSLLLAYLSIHHICAWCLLKKSTSDPLKLELQMVLVSMWVLGTKPRSSARATSALSH